MVHEAKNPWAFQLQGFFLSFEGSQRDVPSLGDAFDIHLTLHPAYFRLLVATDALGAKASSPLAPLAAAASFHAHRAGSRPDPRPWRL